MTCRGLRYGCRVNRLAEAGPLAIARDAIRSWPLSRGSSGTEIIVIEPRRAGIGGRLLELWRYKRLIPFFGRRLLEKRYTRTVIGWFWIPIRPTMEVATRVLIFGGVLALPSDHIPYLLFFLVGTMAWSLFDRTLFWSVRSIELNRKLIQKIYFSRLVLPLSAAFPAAVEFAMYAGLTVIAFAWYWVTDSTMYLSLTNETLLVLPGLALILLLGVGLGLWLAVLGTQGRDTRFLLGYISGFWYFLTPVIYPLSAVPHSYQRVALLNPMTAPVELIRQGLLGAGGIDTTALIASVTGGAFCFATGILVFLRAEATAADRL